MKATFENSVNVLVRAYLNGTLVHKICTACAVGNLVASARGTTQLPNELAFYKFSASKWANGEVTYWEDVFCTNEHMGVRQQRIREGAYNGRAKEQIDSTGYSWENLASIEFAFESCDKGKSPDEYMFNGLMAVVDVLADIHGVDLSTKQQAIGQFEEVHASK